jgi:protein required for attachment to host cells
MKVTWILVADSTSARFFSVETPSSPLLEFDNLVHTEGRMHDRDITTDLPGRIKSSDGSGHALEQPTDPKKHDTEQFAHEIAHYLSGAHNGNKFEQLVIVASTSFLGLILNQLSAQLKRTVCFELNKNIATQNAADIRKQLPDFIPCG